MTRKDLPGKSHGTGGGCIIHYPKNLSSMAAMRMLKPPTDRLASLLSPFQPNTGPRMFGWHWGRPETGKDVSKLGLQLPIAPPRVNWPVPRPEEAAWNWPVPRPEEPAWNWVLNDETKADVALGACWEPEEPDETGDDDSEFSGSWEPEPQPVDERRMRPRRKKPNRRQRQQRRLAVQQQQQLQQLLENQQQE